MNKNLTWIIDSIKKLNPGDRQVLDAELLNLIAGDSKVMQEKYGLVLATDFLEEAKELRANWGKMQGLSSGLKSIDKLTKGFVPGELTIIGGATSNGKTSLAVNIAARVVSTGKRVLFVTMEMTRQQLTSRVMYVDENFEENSSLLAYQKSDEFDWKSVDGLIGNAKRELNVDLVIIDHLHHFTRELDNVSEDLGRITKEFQKNAHIHQIPIIVISHTRKGAGDNIEDLRGSSYIGQDADIVLMVTRRKEAPDLIEVTIQKNRNRGYDYDNNQVLLKFDKTRISDNADIFDH